MQESIALRNRTREDMGNASKEVSIEGHSSVLLHHKFELLW